MSSTEVICLTILCYIVIIFGVTVNGGLLIVFVRSKRLRSTPSNKLICSLLFSDLLIELGTAATIPIKAESLTQKVTFLLRVVSMTITILNLCSIWIDRIVTLKLTFKHHVIIDSKTVNKILAITWCFGLTLVLISVVMFSFQMDTAAYKKWRYVTCTATFIGFLILIVANAIIYHEARIQSCKINRQSYTINRPAARLGRSFLALQLKSTYLCIFMVTSFLVFWLPYLVKNIGLLVDEGSFRQQWLPLFCAFMIICNTIIHPCLYILLNRETRKLILRRWRRSRSKRFNRKSADSQRSQSSIFTISMRAIQDV